MTTTQSKFDEALLAATTQTMAALGSLIDQTPQARDALQGAIREVFQGFESRRSKLLSAEEREVLLNGMVGVRETWEANGDKPFANIVKFGHMAYAIACDEALLEEALVSNQVTLYISSDQDRITFLRMLAKPDVLAVLNKFGLFNQPSATATFVDELRCVLGDIDKEDQPDLVIEAVILLGQISDALESFQHEEIGPDCAPQLEGTCP